MDEPVPPALVLGCNSPHGVGVLSDWIEERTGHAPDFVDTGWSEIRIYGHFQSEDMQRNGYGYGDGDKYGDGHGDGGGFGYACGDAIGDGRGNSFGLHNGDGYGYGSDYGGYGDDDGDGGSE